MKDLNDNEKKAIAKGLSGGKVLFEQLAGMFEDAADKFNANPNLLKKKDIEDIDDALFQAFHITKGMLTTIKFLCKKPIKS